MKKQILIVALLAGYCFPASAQKVIATIEGSTTAFLNNKFETKLSPLTKLYLAQARPNSDKNQLPGYVYKINAQNEVFISALVKVSSIVDEAGLRALGIAIGTKAGNIWTLQVPVNNVKALTEIEGLHYIQLDEPVFPLMDSVRKATRVDSVQNGINLIKAFTGKDVVVGILDVGFDYTHPLFFDTSGNKYRVKKVWEQKTTTGTPPAGFTYGSEILDSNTMWSVGTDIATQSHGTHVAGIALGSGVGSANAKFRGIAYSSDVVLVGITPPPGQWQNTGMADLLDGMNYIYSYAASVGKPAVINLSWGCSIGSHDGMSIFSQAVDNLTGAGKLFACSAGNTGADPIHLGKTFTTTDTIVKTVVTFDTYLAEKKTWVDIWGDSSKSFCAQVSLYNAATQVVSTGFICLDNLTHNKFLVGSDGDTCFVDMVTAASEFNGKPRIFLYLYNKSGNTVMLSVKSSNAKINIWEGFVQNSTGYYGALTTGGIPGTVPGNTASTISDWSCTKSAIPVGAFAAKNIFTNISGQQVNYTGTVGRGQLVSFSSRGPSADGRIRPFITAPGFAVGSGISSYDVSFQPAGSSYASVLSTFTKNSKNYSYASLSGTSMSSPAVSGILALMLEANPALTPQQALDILAATAYQDIYTNVLPAAGTNNWGHGKVNAYAAVKKVLQEVSVNNVVGNNMVWSVYPNPSNGIFTVQCNSNKVMTAQLEISDITGKLIQSNVWKLNSGSNTNEMNSSQFPQGLYVITIRSEAGQGSIKLLIE